MHTRLLALLITIVAFTENISAQFQIDPGLASLILVTENRAKRVLDFQMTGMGLITTGHVWNTNEFKETYNLQKEYNEYLDQFRGVLVYAAQCYGFYHEIGRLSDNYGQLYDQLRKSPTNAIAVTITPWRNKIYRDLVIASIDIVNDIRMICLSDTKMTEKERIEIVFGIRPKLKNMNRKLALLAKAIKYTSLNDVWNELHNGARDPVDKNRIVTGAFQRWKQNAHTK